MKRQKIQRELMKLEQENLDKREEIIKKDEIPSKSRMGAVSKVQDRQKKIITSRNSDSNSKIMCPVLLQASPEPMSSKGSPSSRKSCGSPKHKGTKGQGSGKKEKKAVMSSPILESVRYL